MPRSARGTLQEANAWYRSQIKRLDPKHPETMIDTTLSAEAQLAQAEQLAKVLLDGARLSLFDRNLGDQLIEAFSKVNVDKLLAETQGNGSKRTRDGVYYPVTHVLPGGVVEPRRNPANGATCPVRLEHVPTLHDFISMITSARGDHDGSQ